MATRYDKWSPLIPTVGQVVQINLKDGDAYETRVTSRMTPDGETFVISLDWPYSPTRVLGLKITPKASAHGMVDRVADRSPIWKTIPESPTEQPQAVTLFFLDTPNRPS